MRAARGKIPRDEPLVQGVIFVAMFGTSQGIAPLSALNAHAANAAPFVGHRLGGGVGDRVTSLAVVLSVLATTRVAIIGTARLIYSMSRDRVLPARLGLVSQRYRTPAFTTALLGGAMMAFGVIDIFVTSVATAIGDLVTVSGVLYALSRTRADDCLPQQVKHGNAAASQNIGLFRLRLLGHPCQRSERDSSARWKIRRMRRLSFARRDSGSGGWGRDHSAANAAPNNMADANR
jgi:hypothetical protein